LEGATWASLVGLAALGDPEAISLESRALVPVDEADLPVPVAPKPAVVVVAAEDQNSPLGAVPAEAASRAAEASRVAAVPVAPVDAEEEVDVGVPVDAAAAAGRRTRP